MQSRKKRWTKKRWTRPVLRRVELGGISNQSSGLSDAARSAAAKLRKRAEAKQAERSA